MVLPVEKAATSTRMVHTTLAIWLIVQHVEGGPTWTLTATNMKDSGSMTFLTEKV